MNTAKVKLGSRDIAGEQAPLRVNYLFCGGHMFTLSQPGDGQLRLQASLGVRVLGWIFFVLGLPGLMLGLLAILGLLIEPTLENALGTLGLLAWGLSFAFVGVKLLG